jgi:hypothetical protein
VALRRLTQQHEDNPMKLRHWLAAGLLGCALSAQATTITLAADGAWNSFDVVDVLGPGDGLGWIDLDGKTLSFSFTVGAGFVGTLTVVDAVFSGDVFSVSANGSSLGTTSAAVDSYVNGGNVGYDYDAALANSDYSRGIYNFSAGSYTVTGALVASAVDESGQPINATNGALNLTVSAVPENGTVALLLAGLGLLTFLRRRAA